MHLVTLRILLSCLTCLIIRELVLFQCMLLTSMARNLDFSKLLAAKKKLHHQRLPKALILDSFKLFLSCLRVKGAIVLLIWIYCALKHQKTIILESVLQRYQSQNKIIQFNLWKPKRYTVKRIRRRINFSITNNKKNNLILKQVCKLTTRIWIKLTSYAFSRRL